MRRALRVALGANRRKAGRGRAVLAAFLGITALGSLLVGGCNGNGTAIEEAVQTIEDITVEEALEMIEQRAGDADFAIIDVRTPDEYDEGHIEGATTIDFYGVDFEAEIDALDRDKTYVIYCGSGKRSGLARDKMEELDFQDVYNVLGGITGWEEAAYPVVK